jgi:hypothetical protein
VKVDDNKLYATQNYKDAKLCKWFGKSIKSSKFYWNTSPMLLGESTLQWPPLGCHIVLSSKCVHVWMYPTSNFWKDSQYFCILC